MRFFERNFISGAKNRSVAIAMIDRKILQSGSGLPVVAENFWLPLTAGIIYGSATNTKNCSSLKSSK